MTADLHFTLFARQLFDFVLGSTGEIAFFVFFSKLANKSCESLSKIQQLFWRFLAATVLGFRLALFSWFKSASSPPETQQHILITNTSFH